MRMLIDALIDLPIKLNKKFRAKINSSKEIPEKSAKSLGDNEDDDVFLEARFDYNRRSISGKASKNPLKIRQRAGSLAGYACSRRNSMKTKILQQSVNIIRHFSKQ